jgi:hypothetical protein
MAEPSSYRFARFRPPLRHTFQYVADPSKNIFPFFVASGILALTGVYFFVSDLGKGGVVMEVAAAIFLTVGLLLRRHYRTTK